MIWYDRFVSLRSLALLTFPLHSFSLFSYHLLTSSNKPSHAPARMHRRWGIVHTDKFWRENARLVELDEFKLLKLLIALLGSLDSVRHVCLSLFVYMFYAQECCVLHSLLMSQLSTRSFVGRSRDICMHYPNNWHRLTYHSLSISLYLFYVSSLHGWGPRTLPP